ncbi:MAG: DNA repair protein RadA [Myxococcales bacterium]|nr:DNA repair protein RadA [Myxococcales bacterium]
MAKESEFVCQACGATSAKWVGRCPGCGGWNTLVEERVPKGSRARARGAMSVSATGSKVVRLEEAVAQEAPRVPCGMREVDRVLGGGLVEGSVVLLGGEPGVGKSTLLLQMVAQLVTQPEASPRMRGGVLYVSGEESAAQVAGRARRLGVREGDQLRLLASGDLDDVERAIAEINPSVVAIDSVQTLRASELESAAGSVSQLREVTSRLVTLAKQEARTMVLVGHVTKDGSLAGPKVLEHLVDVVVAFDGTRSGGPRLLRSIKNRFGAAGELAVMEMTRDGLQEVEDPSKLFLAERPKDVPGSVVLASADGPRPLLLEVQALVTPSAMPSPRRVATGVDATRLSILTAVLSQRANLSIRDRDVFVSLAGGASVDEPAADLGVACAIASSVVELSLPMDLVVFGEIGLAGEVRAVPRCTPRLEEAVKQGFKRAIVPRANVERGEVPPGMVAHGVAHAREVAAWIERKRDAR